MGARARPLGLGLLHLDVLKERRACSRVSAASQLQHSQPSACSCSVLALSSAAGAHPERKDKAAGVVLVRPHDESGAVLSQAELCGLCLAAVDVVWVPDGAVHKLAHLASSCLCLQGCQCQAQFSSQVGSR